MEQNKVCIIGGGAWGTALGTALARGGNAVELWALEDEVVSSINNEHENKMYLPGYKLDKNLKATGDIKAAATGKDFIILATPSLFLESTIKKFTDLPDIHPDSDGDQGGRPGPGQGRDRGHEPLGRA